MVSTERKQTYTAVHLSYCLKHTIAFVEDVFGGLAQISICGRHGHCICGEKQNKMIMIICNYSTFPLKKN